MEASPDSGSPVKVPIEHLEQVKIINNKNEENQQVYFPLFCDIPA